MATKLSPFPGERRPLLAYPAVRSFLPSSLGVSKRKDGNHGIRDYSPRAREPFSASGSCPLPAAASEDHSKVTLPIHQARVLNLAGAVPFPDRMTHLCLLGLLLLLWWPGASSPPSLGLGAIRPPAPGALAKRWPGGMMMKGLQALGRKDPAGQRPCFVTFRMPLRALSSVTPRAKEATPIPLRATHRTVLHRARRESVP